MNSVAAMRKCSALVVMAWLALAALAHNVQAQSCDLAAVRAAIDHVLDKDPVQGKKFRQDFKDGADPFTILDEMVDAEMRRKIDVCRFQAAEHFTKRGFPPSH